MMFSLKKVDDFRAREREREEKGTTNSAPESHLTSWQYPLINYPGTETEIESEIDEQDDQENLDPMQLCEVTFDQPGDQV